MQNVKSLQWKVLMFSPCRHSRTVVESFTHLRFYEAVNNISGYTVSSDGITGDELEYLWREAVVACYFAGICLRVLKKTMKTLFV